MRLDELLEKGKGPVKAPVSVVTWGLLPYLVSPLESVDTLVCPRHKLLLSNCNEEAISVQVS
jgi:hypothetical protein